METGFWAVWFTAVPPTLNYISIWHTVGLSKYCWMKEWLKRLLCFQCWLLLFSLLSSVWLFAPLWTVTKQPPGSSVHWISQAKILEWAAISSSKGISPIQGWNPGLLRLLHWQADSLPLSHLGSPFNVDKCCQFIFQKAGRFTLHQAIGRLLPHPSTTLEMINL